MLLVAAALLSAHPLCPPQGWQDAAPLPRTIHWSDVDGDRLPDALLVTRGGRAVLALNRGGGSFADATRGSGLAGLAGLRWVAFADVDGDGHSDLAAADGATGLRLFQGLGDGRFVDATRTWGLPPGLATTRGGWIDLDLDDRPDLEVVTVARG